MSFYDHLFVLAFMLLLFCDSSLSFPVFGVANNCSSLCKCSEPKSITSIIEEHVGTQEINGLRGKDFRSLNSFPTTFFDYAGVFGWLPSMFIMRWYSMVSISCEISDSQKHTVTELLNGAESNSYTALTVDCNLYEELIWDVPTSQTSVNIFVNKNCRLRPSETKSIQFPTNLWIMESHGESKRNLNHLDFTQTKHLFGLVIANYDALQDVWLPLNSAMSVISFSNNALKDYKCMNTKDLSMDTLNIAGNNLREFPECLVQQDHGRVAYLSLSHNSISDISPLFAENDEQVNVRFQYIDMSHNKISVVKRFMDMQDLKKLDMSHNMIVEVDDDVFGGLTNLEWLSLAGNNIHKLSEDPSAFGKIANLRFLNVSSNELEHVTPSMGFGHLKQVDFRDNRFTSPPLLESVCSPSGCLGMTMLASGNPLRCDCSALEFEKYTKRVGEYQVYGDAHQMQCHTPKSLNSKGTGYFQLSPKSSCIQEDDCPDGCSCTLRNESRLEVDCTNSGLRKLPVAIPFVGPDAFISLKVNHNPMQYLENRHYLSSLTELHAHNCLLRSISLEAVGALKNVRVLTLHSNRLRSLPAAVANVTFENATTLSLHDNRWACSCADTWLPKWLFKHADSIEDVERITCKATNEPVVHLDPEKDMQYCKWVAYITFDQFGADLFTLHFAVSFILTTLLPLLIYAKRRNINQIMYLKFGFRCFSPFTYGEVSIYDVFIAYSQSNYKWVCDTLAAKLEDDGPARYRLCLHCRDFPKDESKVDNISWAIFLSRCSIMILSKEFLDNEWSIPELRSTFQRCLFTSNRLIIVVADNVDVDELTPDLKDYMMSHDFLRISDPKFWEKLKFFLPPPTAAKREVSVDKCGDKAVRAPSNSTLRDVTELSDHAHDDVSARTDHAHNDDVTGHPNHVDIDMTSQPDFRVHTDSGIGDTNGTIPVGYMGDRRM